MNNLMIKKLDDSNDGIIENSLSVESIQFRPERCTVSYQSHKTLKTDNTELPATSCPTVNIDTEELKKQKWFKEFEKYILSKIQ